MVAINKSRLYKICRKEKGVEKKETQFAQVGMGKDRGPLAETVIAWLSTLVAVPICAALECIAEGM